MAKPENNSLFNPEILIELANTKMPFGKYQGWLLCNLPEPYLLWFYKKGFPPRQTRTAAGNPLRNQTQRFRIPFKTFN